MSDHIPTDQLWSETSHYLIHLAVNLGLVDAMMGDDRFLPAREGWEQRLRMIQDWAKKQIHEIHDFGEAYDGD